MTCGVSSFVPAFVSPFCHFFRQRRVTHHTLSTRRHVRDYLGLSVKLRSGWRSATSRTSPRVTVEPPHRRLAHAGQVADLFLRQGRPAGRPRLYQLHGTVEPPWMRVRQAGEARQP